MTDTHNQLDPHPGTPSLSQRLEPARPYRILLALVMLTSARQSAGTRRSVRDLEQARIDLVEVDVGEMIEEAAESHGADAPIGTR
jgi:hypothetical protein